MTDNCGNILPTTQPVLFDITFPLPTVCAEVDGAAQYIVPIVTFYNGEKSVIHLNEIGELITGTVVLTDPSNCGCG